MITVHWSEIGVDVIPEVYDVWRQHAVEHGKEGISVRLSPDGVAMFTIGNS